MRTRWRFWGVWVVVFSWAGAGTPGVPGPAKAPNAPPIPVVAAAPAASPEEVEVGHTAAQDMEQRFGVCTDNALNARVRRISGVVLRVCGSQTPITIRILKSDEPNGVALPGGFIFVTEGLVRLLKEDDLLAAALGHECAHIALGHMTEMLREQRHPRASSGSGPASGVEPPAPGSPTGPSSPDEAPRKPAESPIHVREKAADRAAACYLRAAGIDPRAIIRLLVRLSQQPELDASSSTTHPTWPNRIRSAEEYLRSPEFQRGSEPKVPDLHGASGAGWQ